MICSECSKGNPGPHECTNANQSIGPVAYGFAARTEEELVEALQEWAAQFPGVTFSNSELRL